MQMIYNFELGGWNVDGLPGVAGGELGVVRASKNGLSWVVVKCIPEYCLPRMFPFVVRDDRECSKNGRTYVTLVSPEMYL